MVDDMYYTRGCYLINDDNMNYMEGWIKEGGKKSQDLIYADMMYDELDFTWIELCWTLLKDTGSIFVQTDQRSVIQLKLYMDEIFGEDNFINWIIWPYDWGGRPKKAFGRKHDDILWYSKTEDYKFFRENITIPKKTVGTGFDKSKDGRKIPTDVWSDIGNFHTMSTERIKGVNWQKPERLVERIVLATTEPLDRVFDPFMGSGTTAAVCLKNGRYFVGMEIEESIYNKAVERIRLLDGT
ncbi:MAG: DNA-methyltransferase [Candidatus Kariarchaeaceae archaeon]|jgi:DNA modification methylase